MLATKTLTKRIYLISLSLFSTISMGSTLPESYKVCSDCHGSNAEGDVKLSVPALAGMESWYLERQLNNFKKGRRGTAVKDAHGAQMITISKTLDDKTIKQLANALSKLGKQKPPTAMLGNPQIGKKLYQTNCASCHGVNGRGNRGMKAPSLQGLDEPYLTRQIMNFRQQIRGYHRHDISGKQMAIMANILPSDDVIKDIVAFVLTLNNNPTSTKPKSH